MNYEYFFLADKSNETQRVYVAVTTNSRYYNLYPNKVYRWEIENGIASPIKRMNYTIPVEDEKAIQALDNIVKYKQLESIHKKYLLYRYNENIDIIQPLIQIPYSLKIRIKGNFDKDKKYVEIYANPIYL